MKLTITTIIISIKLVASQDYCRYSENCNHQDGRLLDIVCSETECSCNGNYEDPLNTINCTDFDFDNLTLVNGLDHLKCQNLCHQSQDCKLYKFKKV